MKARYACKLYDVSRPVEKSDIDYILECARLSPSSFGLEHWHLYAVVTPDKRQALFRACFDQDAVGSAPLAVVAVCLRSPSYRPDSPFVRERGCRFPGGLEVFINDYKGYYDYLEKNQLEDHWARSQCYIASANMMTGAAAAGIDSCAIEGFDNDLVLSLLSLDGDVWQTGLITVFGYSAEKSDRNKIRMSASRIITYV
jgi:nitroreductase